MSEADPERASWKGFLDPEQETAEVSVPAARARRESLAADRADSSTDIV